MIRAKALIISKSLLYLACAAISYSYSTQPKIKKGAPSIHFVNMSLAAAVKLSKQLHKPIFADAYATWCAPCRELKRQTFKDERVAKYFNAHYINIAVDVEKGEGLKFAEQYGIDSYPTLLFIDGEGKLIKKIEGFVDAGQLDSIATGMK